MNTKEKSNKLTKKELDLYIAKSNLADSQLTDKWLRENGLNPNYFSVTDYKLLKAQQRANECLKIYEALLTQAEKKTLVRFNTKMNTGHIRKKLTPKAAKTILDLTSRIRRRAYRIMQTH